MRPEKIITNKKSIETLNDLRSLRGLRILRHLIRYGYNIDINIDIEEKINLYIKILTLQTKRA